MEQVSWPQIIDYYMPLATKGKYPNTVENLAGSTKIIMYKKIRIFEKLFMCTLTSKKSHFNNFLISMLESYIYIYIISSIKVPNLLSYYYQWYLLIWHKLIHIGTKNPKHQKSRPPKKKLWASWVHVVLPHWLNIISNLSLVYDLNQPRLMAFTYNLEDLLIGTLGDICNSLYFVVSIFHVYRWGCQNN